MLNQRIEAVRRSVSRSLVACAMLVAAQGVALAQSTPAASAPAPEDKPSLKVGGTIFTEFIYNEAPVSLDADGNMVHASAFDVSRAYVNLTGTLSKRIAFRITPDIKRLVTTTKNLDSGASVATSLDGSQTYRLKYAYGQIGLDGVLPSGSWIRIGAQQTPLVDFMEGIYRYRFQGTLAMEREGYLSSSDFGISGRITLPHDYGDLHLGIYNGETYSKAEANDQKSFQIRGTLRPLPGGTVLKGLRLTAFYAADKYVKDAPRNRFAASATFEHENVTAGLDVIDAQDQPAAKAGVTKASGYSLWAQPRTKIGVEGLLRHDSFKPNKAVDARKKRTIVGASYWFKTYASVNAAVLADYEQVSYGYLLAKPTERRIALHCLFSF